MGSTLGGLRAYSDPEPARKVKEAVAEALVGYSCVAEERLQGMYLLVYVSSHVSQSVSHVSSCSIATGLLGLGNKGGVAVRLVLNEMARILFVNSHLSAGVVPVILEPRNCSSSDIFKKAKFIPFEVGVRNGGEEPFEVIGNEDCAFWMGDLNYRLTGIPGEDVRRLLSLHTQGQYGQPVESPNLSLDPASLQTTLSSLLSHDELFQMMKQGEAFHDGWLEGQIEFLPTYKYDVGSIYEFDSSEKKRGPSWCDRILFRTREHKRQYDEKITHEEAFKHEEAEISQQGIKKATSNAEGVYEYNPETDGVNESEQLTTDSASTLVEDISAVDHLRLESYTSHQGITSSDHKPVEAVFSVTYNAISADRRAQIYREESRRLDKMENEFRPTVTVVFDDGSNLVENQRIMSRSPWFLNFGQVRYDHPSSRSITIANSGVVPFTMAFVHPDCKNNGGTINGVHMVKPYPPWISIKHNDDGNSDTSKHIGRLRQGWTLQLGESIDIEITVLVEDAAFAHRLNTLDATLQTDLVLHINDGGDYFIPVEAEWHYF